MKKKRFECKRDDLTIRGTMRKAKNGRLPAVILSHGFMANEITCFTYAKVLAKLGYITFTFDFCGGGLASRSDGKSESMSVLTEMADLESVLAYVKSRDDVDADSISLLGCSQGGFVSALVAKTHPEIKNLILFYPALCIPDDAKAGKMLGFSFDTSNIPEIVSKLPMKIGRGYVEAVINWDYKEIIKGYKGKTILIHGTADSIVNISYARNTKDCFPNCKYYEIEGGGHMFHGKHDRQAIKILKDEMN